MVPVAVACSTCSDALLLARWWWAPSVGFLFLGLALEGVLFSVTCWIGKRTVVGHRAYFAVGAGAVLSASTILGGGIWVGLWLASVILLVGFIRSVVLNRAHRRRALAARVLLVVAAAAVGLLRAWPSARSFEELVDVSTYVQRFRVTDGWLLSELLARPETPTRLEGMLVLTEDPRVVRLHATLGLPDSERADACRRLMDSAGGELEGVCRHERTAPAPATPR